MIVSRVKRPIGQLTLLYSLVALTVVLVGPSAQRHSGTELDFGFLATNAIIGVVSILMLVRECDRAPYSLKQIHWIFQYAFFFIAPLVQYLEDRFPWGNLAAANVDLLRDTNLLILLWQMVWVGATLRIPVVDSHIRPSPSINATPIRILILFVLSFVALIYLQRTYGWDGLLTRGARSAAQDSASADDTVQVVLTYGLRVAPVVLAVAAWWRWKSLRSFGSGALLLVALTLTAATSFPVSTTRFWTAAVAIGFLITFFRLRERIFVYVLLVGLNMVFPLIGSLRDAQSFSEIRTAKASNLLADNLITGDYDAFTMLAHTHEYTSRLGATDGEQLLTAMLFFVPRSVWEGKAVGSGYTVGEFKRFGFLNVSSPLPAEGLINFGLIGVVLFAAGSAWLAIKLDHRYWSDAPWVFRPLYPFLLGIAFFCLRGDLLSAMSFVTGLVLVFWLLTTRAGARDLSGSKRSADNEQQRSAQAKS